MVFKLDVRHEIYSRLLISHGKYHQKLTWYISPENSQGMYKSTAALNKNYYVHYITRNGFSTESVIVLVVIDWSFPKRRIVVESTMRIYTLMDIVHALNELPTLM